MNEIVSRVRKKFPQYADLTDEQLTTSIGEKFPAYLDGSFPKFEKQFGLLQQQRKAAAAGPGMAGLASKLHDGIYQGLETPERMIRNAGDLTGYYKGLDYLFGTGERFQKYNQEALGNMRRWEQDRRQFNEQIGANTFLGDVVEGVGKGVAELPMQILPARAAATTAQAVKASATIAGSQSGLETYGNKRGAGEGRAYAAIRGTEAAIITALTTKAFGASGIEAVFRKSGAKGVAQKFGETFKQAGLEMGEEIWDELGQDLHERYHDDPAKPIGETVRELMLAGTVGGIVGGMVTAATEFRMARSPSKGKEPAGPEKGVERDANDVPILHRPRPISDMPNQTMVPGPRPTVPVDDNVIRDADGTEMIRLPIGHPEGGAPVGEMGGEALPVYEGNESPTLSRPGDPGESRPAMGGAPTETTPQTPTPESQPDPTTGEPVGDPGGETFPVPDALHREMERGEPVKEWTPAEEAGMEWMSTAHEQLLGGEGDQAGETMAGAGKDHAVQFATDWLGWKVRKTKWKADITEMARQYTRLAAQPNLEEKLNQLTNPRLKEIGRAIGLGKMNYGLKADRVGKILHWVKRTAEKFTETNRKIGASRVVKAKLERQEGITKAELNAGGWNPDVLRKYGYDEQQEGVYTWTNEPTGEDGRRSGERAIRLQSARKTLEEFDRRKVNYTGPEAERKQQIHAHLRANMVAGIEALEQGKPAPKIEALPPGDAHKPAMAKPEDDAQAARYTIDRDPSGRKWVLWDSEAKLIKGTFKRKADAVTEKYRLVEEAAVVEGSTSPETIIGSNEQATGSEMPVPPPREVAGDTVASDRAKLMEAKMVFVANKKILKQNEWPNGQKLTKAERKQLQKETRKLKRDYPGDIEKDSPFKGGKLAGSPEGSGGTDKGENSTSEKPAPTSASTPDSKSPDKPKRKRAARAAIGDVLDDIEQVGGMMSASRARKVWGHAKFEENKSLWDDAPQLPPGHNFIYNAKATLAPDKVLQALQGDPDTAGRYENIEVPELWNMVGQASRERTATTKQNKREEKWLREDAKQASNFYKATEEGAIAVQGGQLRIGDAVEIEGTPMEVIEIDVDSGEVTLENGKRFGTQQIAEDQTIYVEKLDAEEGEAEFLEGDDLADDDLTGETTQERLDKVQDEMMDVLRKKVPVSEQGKRERRERIAQLEEREEALEAQLRAESKDDFSLEYHDDDSLQAEKDKVAGQEAQRAEAAELERRAGARLEGTTGDLGQGDLLRQPDDLLAPPTPKGAVEPEIEAAEPGDTIHFEQLDGREYQATVQKVVEPMREIKEVHYGVDSFGYKLIPASKVVRVEKSTRRLNREKLETDPQPNKWQDRPQSGIQYGRGWIKAKLALDRGGPYGIYEGPNWYRKGAKRMAEAVAKGIPFELQPEEQSSYGAKVVLVINGERIPLTKGKLRKNDFHLYFGGYLPPAGSAGSKYSAAQKYPGGELGGTGGPLPVADDPSHTVFPFQMPELVRLARALGQGKFPRLRNLLKIGALGVFQAKAGKPDSGKVAVDKSLWQLITESERAELRERAIDLEPDDKREQERIYQELYEELYAEKLKSEPERAVKVLAHELMHWVDFLPQGMIDGRGNLFGRVAKLKNYLKHTIPWDPYAGLTGFLRQPSKLDRDKLRRQAEKELKAELGPIEEIVRTIIVEEPIFESVGVTPEDIKALFGMSAREDMPELYVWFARLDDKAKKDIVKAAMKGAVDARVPGTKKRTGTKRTEREVREKTGRLPTKEEIRERFQKLLHAELEKQQKLELKEVKAQLEKAIAWWRGTPKMEEYFATSAEMYAEAGSIFLANPAALKKRAPKYFEALINYLDRNPVVAQLYQEIQTQIAEGAIDDQRSRDLRAGWRQQEERAITEQSSKRWTVSRAVDSMVAHLIRALGPVYSRAKGSKWEGDLRARLGMFNYRGGPAEAFVNAVDVDVSRYLVSSNLSWEDFGEFLFHKRVTEHYDEKAVPLGYSPATSQTALAALEQRMGPVRFAALEEAQRRFRKIYEEDVIALLARTGMLDAQLQQVLEDNLYYSTWEAVKDAPKSVMEELLDKRHGPGVSSHVYRRVGNLGEIKNPATATINKALAMISAAHRNNAKRIIPKVLEEMGHPVQEVKKTWDPERKALVYDLSPEEQGSPVQKLVFIDNGQIKAYHVEKEVAEAFTSGSPMERDFVAQMLRAVVSFQKQVFTGWNSGFWPVMTIRDVAGFVGQMPGTLTQNLGNYFKQLPRAVKASRDAFRGVRNPDAEEALKRGLWISRSEPMGFAAESDNEFELKTARMGLTPGAWSKRDWRQWVAKAWEVYTSIGKIAERTHKINGMFYLDKKFPNMPEWEKAEAVREWAGSPDFLQQPSHKGKVDLALNVFSMYYNAIKEGWRSVAKAAKKHPGKFGATAGITVLAPAVIQAMAALGAFDDEWKEMLDSVSDYDLTNYLIIPLGWEDEEEKKVMYLRLPLWEPARLAHGWLVSALTGRGEGPTARGMDQLPGMVPVFEVAGAWMTYMSGQNPHDDHLDRAVIDRDTFAQGDWAGVGDMAKWSWNKVSGGLFGRFHHQSLFDSPTAKEAFLRQPIVDNSLGRFLKISNRGIFDRDKRELDEPEIRRRAKIRGVVDQVIKTVLVDGQPASPAGRQIILLDPYARGYYVDKAGSVLKSSTGLFAERMRRLQTKPARDAVLLDELSRMSRVPVASGPMTIAE